MALKSILPNSPIPKIGHLRDSKSADAIGAQLDKVPPAEQQSRNQNIGVSIVVGCLFQLRNKHHEERKRHERFYRSLQGPVEWSAFRI